MDANSHSKYDDYLKALMDISKAITSDLYLEDLLKLIVMVTAKVTGVASVRSGWWMMRAIIAAFDSKPPRPLTRNMSSINWGLKPSN